MAWGQWFDHPRKPIRKSDRLIGGEEVEDVEEVKSCGGSDPLAKAVTSSSSIPARFSGRVQQGGQVKYTPKAGKTRQVDIPEARLMTREEMLSYSQAVCDGLREDQDGVRREVLTHAGNRWSLGVIHTLGVYGRLRHADIGRRMHGVTQRMLTRTLRQLERDGLVTRQDLGEMPPRVEYELTELGMGLLIRMIPLWTWVVENSDQFRKSREEFDSRPLEKPSWQTF